MKFVRIALPFVAASTLFAAGCEVEQTREGELPDVDVSASAGNLPEYDIVKTEDGEMPDVDVDVDGGQLPAFDVDGPSVSFGQKEVEVTVPDVDVDVHAEKKRMTLPTIDVDLPEDEDNS